MFELLHFNGPLFIVTVGVFFALLIVLSKFAWGPILKALDERDDKIRDDLDSAEKSRQDAQSLLDQHQQAMVDLKEEGRKIREEARALADKEKQAIVEKARQEAADIVEQARRDIDSERQAALDDIRAMTVQVGVSLAGKLIQREITADDQDQLVQASLAELEAAYKQSN